MLFLPLVFLIAAPDQASLLAEPSLGDHPQSARSIGMGGAMRGIADGVDALYVNPAGMSMKKRYVIDGGYSWTQDANAHRPGAAIMDSATTSVAAGASYNFERRFNSGQLDVHRINFALAYNIGGFLGIGATFKYLDATRVAYDKIFDPNTAAPRANITPYPAQRILSFSGDVSAMLTPIQYFSIAISGHNLIPNPVWAELTPLGMGMAAAVHVAGLEVDFDAVIDFTTLKKAAVRYHFGAEYAIAGMVPLRAGFIHDDVGFDNFWSFGAGFRHPSFGIDFGYRQSIARPENRTIAFGVQYYMN